MKIIQIIKVTSIIVCLQAWKIKYNYYWIFCHYCLNILVANYNTSYLVYSAVFVYYFFALFICFFYFFFLPTFFTFILSSDECTLGGKLNDYVIPVGNSQIRKGLFVFVSSFFWSRDSHFIDEAKFCFLFKISFISYKLESVID